jgi:peroxiredoxin Q/BCP
MSNLIDIGAPAPDFALADQHGETVSLEGLRGEPVVLYFYPKDDTPGCTKEACAFQESLPRYEGARVLGVSPDDSKSHAKFADKYGLAFTLLADVPGDDGTPPVCAAYGVWQEKSMYGRKSMGVVRTTYLIDAEGRVARRWDKVKVPDHADAVLAEVLQLL